MTADIAALLSAADRGSNQRRWPNLLMGAAVGGVATWALLTYLGDRETTAAVEHEVVELALAPVEQLDLAEEIEWSGTLGYGPSVSISLPGGIVTSATAVGTVLDRGRTLATVDDSPVIVFFGDTPMWRNLAEGDEGRDVLQLEANLAALGYDPDQTVDVDEAFTANTEAMVERWQEDLGIEITGEVASTAIVVVEGPSSVLSIADVGATAGAQFASLAPRQAVTDVVAYVDGTIADLAVVGQEIDHGTILYSVDTVPVVALAELDEVAAAITSDTYTAVEVEQALSDAGFDPDGAMTIDGVVTDTTSTAVERWQTAAELPVTGESDPGYYYIVVTPGQAVDAHLVASGDVVVTGGPIMSASSSRLSVTVTVDVGEADEFEGGQEVAIELADESTVEGLVEEIGAVVQPTDPQGTPTVDVDIAVVAAAARDLIEGPVTVVSVGELIPGATVIPTRSLVTLAEGGFAVEKASGDGSTTLIGVELGTFDDGVVEVVEGDLAPGDEVVVPK